MATARSGFFYLLLLACSVRTEEPTTGEAVPFACQTDGDCSVGSCSAELGICTRSSGQLDRVLFEIIPQASDPAYGGSRYVTLQDVRASGAVGSLERGIEAGWLEVNVPPRVPVRGSVEAALGQPACLPRARSTLPVTLTFSPRERLLGLSIPDYELSTTFDEAAREYVFEGALPPGRYDVYLRPNRELLPLDCPAIPQVFRDRVVGEVFNLEQPQPASLRVTIPWRETLEGWTLDMVHPVTGEILSNEVPLRRADLGESEATLETTLNYSVAEANDYMTDGEELVRLTPPPNIDAGTVLLQRSGLELVVPGEAVLGDVSSFGESVDFQAWVWRRGVADTPVRAAVRFTALDLDALPGGVIASFERSATVDERGQVNVSLLPGQYRVRVTPPVLQQGLLAGFESRVTVWPSEVAGGMDRRQAGHIFEVPPALALSGQVRLEDGSPAPGDMEVRASAAAQNRSACTTPSGENVSNCTPARAAVLRDALAQDPFVPRSRSALTGADGAFDIDGLDCGQCEPGAGARYDLAVRPRPESGLPWMVRRSNNVYDTQRVAPIVVPVPVAQPIRLTYGDPALDPGLNVDDTADDVWVPRGLPGALVRVYAVLDDSGEVVTGSDLDTLVPCVTVVSTSIDRCTQSLLQLAELRSDAQGRLVLLLPPNLD